MAIKPFDRPSAAPWRVLLALVCVLLVVIVGAAQAVHFHADGTGTHADCSLCAAAHLSVQTVATSVPAHSFPVAAMLEAQAIDPRPIRLAVFALFTRPPPAA